MADGRWYQQIGTAIMSVARSPVAALILAIAGIHLGLQAHSKLEQTVEYLNKILSNLSTVYIGEFPNFLPQIVGLLEEATHSVSIACDFPAYGDYSNHEEHVNYRAAIERKATGKVAVTMIIPNAERRARLTRFQFKNVAVNELKDRSSANFEKFLHWSGRTREDIPSVRAFADALIAEDNKALQGLAPIVQVIECTERMPVYVWIVDEKSAIFSVPNFAGGGGNESGFVTRDARLIKQLMAILEVYKGTFETTGQRP